MSRPKIAFLGAGNVGATCALYCVQRSLGDAVLIDVVEGVDGVRPDGLHFSQDGSKWLAEWLGPQVTAIAGRSRLSRDESPRESAGTSVSFVRGTTSR